MTRSLSRASLRAAGIRVAKKPAPSTAYTVVLPQNATGGRRVAVAVLAVGQEGARAGRIVTEATRLKVLSQKARSAQRERAFLANLAQVGVPVPIPEFRFAIDHADAGGRCLVAHPAGHGQCIRCRCHELVAPAQWKAHVATNRQWRADYAWPDARVALEVEGGVWSRGKHGRGSGIVKDMEKGNGYAVRGWRVLRVTPTQLADPETADLVKRALGL